jgi:hypothetical protein
MRPLRCHVGPLDGLSVRGFNHSNRFTPYSSFERSEDEIFCGQFRRQLHAPGRGFWFLHARVRAVELVDSKIAASRMWLYSRQP